MTLSRIEWTEATWNPVTGCTKISKGCHNCYAERMALRLWAMGQPNYQNKFKVTCHPKTLDIPYRWKKSKIIFVNSMSDLFHEDVPVDFILKVFDVMNSCKQHIFQILTKRNERLLELNGKLNWTSNIWAGVSVECNEYTNRIDDLIKTGAKVKFLSLEPLIGPIMRSNFDGIDWVIVGGESGPGARPMKKEWVIDIQQKCNLQKIPFFFKQWGGLNKKKNGRSLDGKIWSEMPNCLMGGSMQIRSPLGGSLR